jgi:hypothetical protein
MARGDRGDAQGDPRQRGRGGGPQKGDPSDGEAARLTRAAELTEAGVEETLTYCAFPEEHWRRIRTPRP